MIRNVMDSTWKSSEWIQFLEPCKQNILVHFIQTSSVEMYCQWVADGKKFHWRK